jgi:hypothetical protein
MADHIARHHDDGPQLNHTMVTLLTVLLVLAIVTILLAGALLFLRQRKKARRAQSLPAYDEKRISTSSTHSHHRRVNVRPSQSIHIYHDKELQVDNSSEPSTPNSLPEIRITFPEEVDASGKRQSGRVVVVHVGDSGVGLEPVGDEKLPSYYQTEGERFQSIDLERIGGLDEKESRTPLGWR